MSCCIYKVNVASGNEGYISWTRCSGRLGVSQYLTVRDGGLIFNGIVGTVTTPPGATLLCIGDGGGVFPTTTTTTSTTTTSTTSTTTTLAVLSATVTSICNAGSGEITVSGMSGGTGGGYYWNLAPANVVPRGNNSTATGLSDGTYNVYLYDGGGNSRLFTVININCATTTTTSTTSTTTTTTLALDCTYSGGSAVIVYPATTTTTSTTTTTTTTTTTAAPTTTTTTAAPTTTTTSGTVLYVYGRYINSENGNTLQYSLNYGAPINIGTVTSGCNFVTTIPCTVSDEISFSSVSGQTIASSTTACPDGPGGFGCTVGYSVLSAGAQYVYITIDGDNGC